MSPADISVVIPTLNEAPNVAAAIRSAVAAGGTEIIVVDGGSSDQTCEIASAAGATEVIDSPAGRGLQLNRGARTATGSVLLFLHADNRLAADCLAQVCQNPTVSWGAFRQHIDSPRTIFRWIEFGNSLRVTLRGTPFGDQAIFVAREAFQRMGGFAAIPVMEDVEFSQRMRRITKPLLLPGPVTVSPRRWEQRGVIRQTLHNWQLQIAFAAGVSADRLAGHYRPHSR